MELSKKDKIVAFLSDPPLWFYVCVYVLTLLFCIGSLLLVAFGVVGVLSYIIFAFAGVFLAYTVFTVVKSAPKIKAKGKAVLEANKFTNKLMHDYAFRTKVFSGWSVFINVCFAGFEIVMSLVSHSIWYGALGSYHLLLCVTRFGVIYTLIKKNGTNETELKARNLKLYKQCGWCIIAFNVALTGAIAQMMFSRKAFNYVGLMIFVMAAFAFYKITVAIVNIVKAKKFNDYGTQCLRNVNLTDAVVSIYALQTALIATFSTEAEFGSMRYMNFISGVAVVVVTIAVGVYMIAKSKKEQKKLLGDVYEQK